MKKSKRLILPNTSKYIDQRQARHFFKKVAQRISKCRKCSKDKVISKAMDAIELKMVEQRMGDSNG